MGDETLWTRAEVATRLGVSLKTIDRLRSRGLLPFVRLLRAVRFRPGDVRRLTDQLAVPTGVAPDDRPPISISLRPSDLSTHVEPGRAPPLLCEMDGNAAPSATPS